MATPVTVARLGESRPALPSAATFVATALFASDVVAGALPYLIDVVHNVGLDADTAADVVLVIYEEMRAAAGHADTREVGVEVEMQPDTLTVTVLEHIAGSTASGGRRHYVNTWVIRTTTIDGPVGCFAGLDRSAVVAGLSTAPASALAASVARRGHLAASLEVTVDRNAPAAVRRHVAGALQANAVGNDVQADVDRLVSELVSHVIRHDDARTVDVHVVVDVDRAATVTITGGSSVSKRGKDVLDSLAASWGTRRQNRRTAVWFTVGGVEGTAHPGASTAEPVDVVARAEAIAAATAAQLTAEPEVVAAQAAITAEHAAADAAAKTAGAARSARAARAVAATTAAKAVAEAAARTVEAVQLQADELASAVATAASEAAATVASSIVAGGDAEAARAAHQVGATVISAAVVKAEETARAAVLVARAVAAAAAAVAATTAAEAAAIEHEVVDAAVAVQAVTAAAAQQLASDTLERAAAISMATREAAAASERLRDANRDLLQAGIHDRSVALALQAAMLTQLPESTDLQLAARYLTAAEQDQVGGDWYDAIVLPSGSTTLVIGDVIGHDIVAAAVMGQLRNLLRALVWDRDEPPSAVVARLDRAIRDLRVNTIATMVVATVDQPAPDQPTAVSTLRWTNAGHPAPILIHADGTAIVLDDTTDVLLGVRPDTTRRDHTHPMPPGATLLLYTDGLVETPTQDTHIGQRRLLDAARTHHRLEPGALLDAVLADLVGDRPADDVAVLAVRFHDTPASAGSAGRILPGSAP